MMGINYKKNMNVSQIESINKNIREKINDNFSKKRKVVNENDFLNIIHEIYGKNGVV